MKKFDDGEKEFFMSFPLNEKNVCAACLLQATDGVPPKDALLGFDDTIEGFASCGECGSRYDSDRAEAGNAEVAALGFL